MISEPSYNNGDIVSVTMRAGNSPECNVANGMIVDHIRDSDRDPGVLSIMTPGGSIEDIDLAMAYMGELRYHVEILSKSPEQKQKTAYNKNSKQIGAKYENQNVNNNDRPNDDNGLCKRQNSKHISNESK